MRRYPRRVWSGALVSVVVAALVMGTGGGAALAAVPSVRGGESLYIVRFKAGANTQTHVRSAVARGVHVTQALTVFPGMLARLTPDQVAALRADPTVAAVEADAPVHASNVEPDPTWGLDRVDQRQLPLSSTYHYGANSGAGVRAYVVDTGVLASHTDFGGRVTVGRTEINDGHGTTDCNGHGTHVSGTIAGARYGVAKAATIVPVRVLDCTGSGSISGVIAGLDWVAQDHQAGRPAVANMSLGGSRSSSLDTAAAAVVADGVTLVVAAGNAGGTADPDACDYSPAAEPTALTVGATSADDSQTGFSNYGSCVDLYAPGEGITSDWVGSTTAINTISGTSMASPHVAGDAALILSSHPTWTPAQVGSQVLGDATAGVVQNISAGTANLLVFTNPLSAPAAPKIRAATAGNASLLAAWSPQSDGGSPITGYSVRVVNAATNVQIGALRPAAADATSLTVTGLVNGTAVRVQVRATNAVGTSAYSGLCTAVLPAFSVAQVQAYVTSVYGDLFNRAPDAGGLDYWTSKIRTGTPRIAVANSITYSQEYRSGLIRDSYSRYLSRAPEAGAVDYWLGQLADGMTIQRMEGGFLASRESYLRSGGTDSAWVANLYSEVLGRTPSTSEVQYWVARIGDSGAGRFSVAMGFLGSNEHLGQVVDGYYRHLLGRAVDPGGRAAWISRIYAGMRLEAVVGGIIASNEYWNLTQQV